LIRPVAPGKSGGIILGPAGHDTAKAAEENAVKIRDIEVLQVQWLPEDKPARHGRAVTYCISPREAKRRSTG
jgi:hypothetical protein